MKARREYLGLLVILLILASWASAHGPQLRTDRSEVRPGDRLSVSGEGIRSNGEIRLTLRGVLKDHELAVVQGDEHGRFQIDVTLPRDLELGEYTLVASGDQIATVRLKVVEGAVGEHRHQNEETSEREPSKEVAEHGPETQGHVEEAHGLEARAEPMPIRREHSATELGLAWGLVILCAAAGFGLLLRSQA